MVKGTFYGIQPKAEKKEEEEDKKSLFGSAILQSKSATISADGIE